MKSFNTTLLFTILTGNSRKIYLYLCVLNVKCGADFIVLIKLKILLFLTSGMWSLTLDVIIAINLVKQIF